MSEAAQVKQMPAQFIAANDALREELSCMENITHSYESDLNQVRFSEQDIRQKMEDSMWKERMKSVELENKLSKDAAATKESLLEELRNEAARSRSEVEALSTKIGIHRSSAHSEEE